MRKKPNRYGSVSVQVVDQSNGCRVVKTVGSAGDPEELRPPVEPGKLFIARQSKHYSLVPADHRDAAAILDSVQTLQNASICAVGPELILGRLLDEIGFGAICEQLFRDVVIARLVYPTSKLKTTDYLYRYRGKTVSAQSIHRFLDRPNEQGSLGAGSVLRKGSSMSHSVGHRDIGRSEQFDRDHVRRRCSRGRCGQRRHVRSTDPKTRLQEVRQIDAEHRVLTESRRKEVEQLLKS